MSVLLISLDLQENQENPIEILKLIKSFDNWVQVSKTSYAIATHLSPDFVGSKIRQLIDTGDHVYVFKLSLPYYEYGQNNVKHWLETFLAENHPGPRFASFSCSPTNR